MRREGSFAIPRLVVVLAALILLGGLGACGGDDDDNDANGTTAAQGEGRPGGLGSFADDLEELEGAGFSRVREPALKNTYGGVAAVSRIEAQKGGATFDAVEFSEPSQARAAAELFRREIPRISARVVGSTFYYAVIEKPRRVPAFDFDQFVSVLGD